jgi:hypothetical protein
MPVNHPIARDASRWRIAVRVRHAVVLAAAVGMLTGAGLATAGLARASGSAAGGLIFSPASGTATSMPSWSTTSGCPAGYQGSAEMSEFTAGGAVASRISPVVNSGLTTPFKGTLDGNVAALLRVTGIKSGSAVKVAIGCYSLQGGTGKVTWNQTATITLSSSGTSYSTSSSGATGAGGTSSSGTPVETALIAAACVLAVAVAMIAWLRRRRPSQLT